MLLFSLNEIHTRSTGSFYNHFTHSPYIWPIIYLDSLVSQGGALINRHAMWTKERMLDQWHEGRFCSTIWEIFVRTKVSWSNGLGLVV